MTLIVLGHNFEQCLKIYSEDENQWKRELLEKPDGLFVVADSAITTSTGQILLGGFKKVYSIPIKLWKPYFVGGHFHSYQTTYLETECFVAISGSTLTAQHILNIITEHLSSLRVTFFYSDEHGKYSEYKVVMACEENPLFKNQGVDEWDDDMFLDSDFDGLLTADQIAQVVHHAVNVALSSAKKYKLDVQSLNSMRTDIALGVQCPRNYTNRLFTYRMKSRIDAAEVKVWAELEEIAVNSVAVLGLRKFELRAQTTFNEALKSNTPPADALLAFLNTVIDEVRANGSVEIDRPSYLMEYRSGRLKTIKISK